MTGPIAGHVELHLHLEGAAPPDLIRALAREKGVDLRGLFDDDGNYAFADFAEFLRVYEAATGVLTSPEDYGRLTEAVLERSRDDGVVYTELFIAPDFCGARDLGAWREYLAAIEEAAKIARARGGPVARGIVVAVRHFGPAAAREAAACAAETASSWIVGFGLAGDEVRAPAQNFSYAFDMAREAGLHLTAHAGEWAGPESVRAALDHLRVERVGHGVRAAEDSALVERLAREGIVLEVCPGSNLALGLYRHLKEHPVERLRALGVPITISTDDPPFFRTTMPHEFERLRDVHGWDHARIAEINDLALGAAFCDETTRQSIRDTQRAQ